jgi:hypothetical protein
LSLITTVGSSQTTSFVSILEADTILAAAPFDSSDWDDLIDTEREARLKYAVLLMDRLPWRGYRVYENQALCFPRSFQSDTTLVLDRIKEAQVYIAWLIVHRGLVSLSSPTEGRSGSPVTRVSLGGLLDVAFGSSTGSNGSFLSLLIAFDEFPIEALIIEYLSPVRIRNGDRPEKLPEVV